MSVGVVYVALGEAYVAEATVSALSLKERCRRELPITLFTDCEVKHPAFDEVVRLNIRSENALLEKIQILGMSPYRVTLFLDTDTYITGDLADLLELSAHFDLAAAHAPGRTTAPAPDVPASFPEFNTGVLLFGGNVSLAQWCDHWATLYHLYGYTHYNQPSFRILTYRSRLRIATLPPEYNCRFLFTGFLFDRVRILHGRYPAADFPKAEAALNARLTWRTHSQCKVFARGGREQGEFEMIGEYPFQNP